MALIGIDRHLALIGGVLIFGAVCLFMLFEQVTMIFVCPEHLRLYVCDVISFCLVVSPETHFRHVEDVLMDQ